MNRAEYLLSAAWLRLWFFVFCAFPVDPDKVVFASARATTLEGNLRFIHDAMSRMRPNRRFVLLLERYDYGLLGKIAYLLRLTRGAFHLATARLFVVDNAYFPVHVARHRRETTVVQVWHAAGALKRFGADEPPGSREVEREFLHRNYDWVVVGSQSAVEPYASALRTPPDRVVPLGVARTDFFFDEPAMAAARERIYERHPQLRDRKVVLYAPTFRGYGADKRPAQLLDGRALREALPERFALVHKVHPVFRADDVDREGYDVVMSADIDLNDAFCVADVFVTDYSSSVFEWALLRKPLVLLVNDLEAYEAAPGFYLDFRTEMIGEQCSTTEEVASVISAGEFDLSGWGPFIAAHCEFDDGCASERFVEFFDPI
jgi:CDP-ribitol ribitolphosphotransferase